MVTALRIAGAAVDAARVHGDVEASGIPMTLDWGRKTLWLVVTARVSATADGAAWELESADVGTG